MNRHSCPVYRKYLNYGRHNLINPCMVLLFRVTQAIRHVLSKRPRSGPSHFHAERHSLTHANWTDFDVTNRPVDFLHVVLHLEYLEIVSTKQSWSSMGDLGFQLLQRSAEVVCIFKNLHIVFCPYSKFLAKRKLFYIRRTIPLLSLFNTNSG